MFRTSIGGIKLMGWPQIIVIVLYVFSLGISLAKHGERRENYNFWTTLIAVLIEVALLYWGGFWK